jgi:hypothetical protein
MRTIAVDFDGVIHTYENGWADGSIYGDFTSGAIAALSALMQKYAVYILTSRNPRQVARWIERQSGHGIECTTHVPWSGRWTRQGYLLVTNRKLPHFTLIDDRVIQWKTWSQALTALAMKVMKEEESRRDEMPVLDET